jgi:hypothetical protein
MLGSFNFDGGAYNSNFNINNYKGKQIDNQEPQAAGTSGLVQKPNMTLARMNSNENDIYKLSTP